jgi:hypothetical protein
MIKGRRHLQAMQVIFAGAAAIALLAVGPAGLAEASPQIPQSTPAVLGSGGFAADDNDDQEAQLQEQLGQQEAQQAEQQAEEQNEAAEQQAQLDEQQAQIDASQP